MDREWLGTNGEPFPIFFIFTYPVLFLWKFLFEYLSWYNLFLYTSCGSCIRFSASEPQVVFKKVRRSACAMLTIQFLLGREV
ncbi:hypothetical protein [Pasteuria penetrans]|uniref:hypothetical protein n=1 Tax=Pasteuria penetrans TaxID=86005 RepID=UPI0011EE0826|nr:hypothetical protein [Pasteuria penetrans]